MLAPSLSLAPVAPVDFARSEPARSTRFILAKVLLLSSVASFWCTYGRVKKGFLASWRRFQDERDNDTSWWRYSVLLSSVASFWCTYERVKKGYHVSWRRF